MVGYDTFVRLVDSRYYGSEAEKEAVFKAMAVRNNKFLVAGRTVQGEYRQVDQVIAEQWGDFILPLPGFRVDVSSSELRATTEQAHES